MALNLRNIFSSAHNKVRRMQKTTAILSAQMHEILSQHQDNPDISYNISHDTETSAYNQTLYITLNDSKQTPKTLFQKVIHSQGRAFTDELPEKTTLQIDISATQQATIQHHNTSTTIIDLSNNLTAKGAASKVLLAIAQHDDNAKKYFQAPISKALKQHYPSMKL